MSSGIKCKIYLQKPLYHKPRISNLQYEITLHLPLSLSTALDMDPRLSKHCIHPVLLVSPSVALDYPPLPSLSQSS